jgi:hypothetical protein
MGKHSAPDAYDPDRERIDPNQPFDHPHLIGETRPAKIKANLEEIWARAAAEADRVVRERAQAQAKAKN